MKRHAAGGLAAVLVCMAVALTTDGARAAASAPPRVDKVLIVSVPRLTWRTVAEQRPPALMALLRRSAVASMSLRTVSARTTLGEGYASIGAGNRASVVDLTAGLGFSAGEQYEGTTADEVYARRTGQEPRGKVLELGLADSFRRNRRLFYGARLGELGSALRDHGRRGAVVGNADTSPDPTLVLDGGYHREATFGLMDRDGQVAGGDVGAGLLVPDATAAFGHRLDLRATSDAFASAWQDNDVVLLELSDLERADAYGDVATTAARRAQRTRALRDSDALLDRALDSVDSSRSLVIVVTPAAPRTGEQLGVAAVSGPGIHPGLARSGTTRRAGYATLPDVAPTVLDALHVAQPHAMNGTPIVSAGGRAPSTATAVRLAGDNDRAVFRDKATGPVSVVFVAFQVLVYAAGAIALARGRSRRALPVVAFLALMVLAIPLLGFLSGFVRYDHLGIAGYLVALVAGAAALAGAAWGLRRRNPLFAPGALIGATFVMLVLDVLLGGKLQLDTVFGYSPIVAGRFAGFGNLAYGLLAMSTIVTATVLWALLDGRRRAAWVVAGVLGVALVVDGAPQWGSDVGGVLASGPAFALVGLMLGGRRVGWRRVLAIGVGTIGALLTFALVDLARPPSSRTHLGRLVAQPGQLGETIHRKLLSNVNILTSSIWTLIIPVALAFFIFLAMRPPGLLQSIQRQVSGLRACLVGGLLAGLLGFAVNDSGVAVPAMMLAVLLPYLTYLLATTPQE
jgi:hypothetical protein